MAFKSRICRARLSPKEGEATLRLVRPNLRAEVSFSLPKLVVFELPFCCYSSPHLLKQVSKRKRKNCEQSWVIFYLLTTQLSSFANFTCLCVILVLILVFRRVRRWTIFLFIFNYKVTQCLVLFFNVKIMWQGPQVESFHF